MRLPGHQNQGEEDEEEEEEEAEVEAGSFEPQCNQTPAFNFDLYTTASAGRSEDTNALLDWAHTCCPAVSVTKSSRQMKCTQGEAGPCGNYTNGSTGEFHLEGDPGHYIYAMGKTIDVALSKGAASTTQRAAESTLDGSVAGHVVADNLLTALYNVLRSERGLQAGQVLPAAEWDEALKELVGQIALVDFGCANGHVLALAIAMGIGTLVGFDYDKSAEITCQNNLIQLQNIASQTRTDQSHVFKEAAYFKGHNWTDLRNSPPPHEHRRPLGDIWLCPHQPLGAAQPGFFRCQHRGCQNFEATNVVDFATWHGSKFDILKIDSVDQFFKGHFAANLRRRRRDTTTLPALEQQLKAKKKLFYLYLVGVNGRVHIKSAKLVASCPDAVAMVWYTNTSNDPTQGEFDRRAWAGSKFMPALDMLRALNAYTVAGTEWKVMQCSKQTQQSTESKEESRRYHGTNNPDGNTDPIRSYVFWRVRAQEQEEAAEEAEEEEEAAEQQQGDRVVATTLDFQDGGLDPSLDSWHFDDGLGLQ
jgi:hypothetical protein